MVHLSGIRAGRPQVHWAAIAFLAVSGAARPGRLAREQRSRAVVREYYDVLLRSKAVTASLPPLLGPPALSLRNECARGARERTDARRGATSGWRGP